MNVELSSSHLADSNSVIGLYGNRNDLSGRYTGIRLYLDWYSLLLKVDFFRLRPILSAGIGYDNSVIKNPRYTNYYYDRSQLPLALSIRLKYSFWEIFFIETPFMELSFNLWKNIPSSLTLGDLIIDRPDLINVYAWITFGFNIFLK